MPSSARPMRPFEAKLAACDDDMIYWAVRLAIVLGRPPIEVLDMDGSEFRASVEMLARADARIMRERGAGLPGR